ncbi:MAG: hypothetical protein AAB074_02270 [Planctomycetota bacterium]
MKRGGQCSSRGSGLTLLESVILIAIVIVLAALVLGALARVRGVGGGGSHCKNSLKQIGIYLKLYENKFGSYPPFGTGSGTWFSSLWRADMATDGNLFRCPHVGKAGTGTHYWGVVRGGTWASSRPEFGGKAYTFMTSADLKSSPGDLPVACDQLALTSNHLDGDVNVLFLDGRVENFPKDSPFLKGPPGFLGPTGWDAPAGTK